MKKEELTSVNNPGLKTDVVNVDTAHLCTRPNEPLMSIWKSSWDSLADCRVGQRSTSRDNDNILWKMDTNLEGRNTQM